MSAPSSEPQASPSTEPKLPPEGSFGRIVIDLGFMSVEQLDEALKIQAERQERGDFARLGHILVEKGYLTPGQVQEVLEAQKIVILLCGGCGTQYNIRGYSPRFHYECPRCHGELKPGSVNSVMVEDQLQAKHTDTKVLLTRPDETNTAKIRMLKRLGKYEILGEIARGGQGVVDRDPDAERRNVGAAGPAGTGSLIAVSYEARARGIKRGMRGSEARKACPELELVQVPTRAGKSNMQVYRDAGSRVVECLRRHCPGAALEKASVDESYVDLTEAARGLLREEGPEGVLRGAAGTHVAGWDPGADAGVGGGGAGGGEESESEEPSREERDGASGAERGGEGALPGRASVRRGAAPTGAAPAAALASFLRRDGGVGARPVAAEGRDAAAAAARDVGRRHHVQPERGDPWQRVGDADVQVDEAYVPRADGEEGLLLLGHRLLEGGAVGAVCADGAVVESAGGVVGRPPAHLGGPLPLEVRRRHVAPRDSHHSHSLTVI